MILFDLAQKYGRDSGYAIRAGPDAFFYSDVHMRPIYARKTLEKHLAWKEVEE